MSWPMIAAFCWFIAANVIAMFPSKRHHWPAAYGLIAVGTPILFWIYVEEGGLVAAVSFLAAASILRWPVRYLWRWIKARFGGQSTS
ncbi:MAG: DUF2484 family protein [Rhodobacteraceae bacterium]|nr:DUF2484 family protein [Alphaproteobacteria bacterium]MBT8474336.1 DUF2484 family protein [Alphaproteobacteria bacterium]NNK66232.1 DUF2484 family protein [Paracoccaceae bacterium]